MTSRRLAVLAAAAVALTSMSVATAGANPSAGQDRSSSATPDLRPAPDLLAGPRRGERAVRQLGDQLPTAAARNDMSPADLRSLLRRDATARVDDDGLVHFVDPAPSGAHDGRAVSEVAAEPLAETFQLHSNPGADLTVLLDFDGAVVAGTAWNSVYDLAAATHPAWDPAEDGPGFSDSELQRVQAVWASVAEDYAPFDVDVTTQDPGDAGMLRDSPTDPTYGTRVLVTPGSDAHAAICDSVCGGMAYVDVFGDVGGTHQPAWVFTGGTGDDPKTVAEAASHEAGHTLGLEHHGTPSEDYYAGKGGWAPIMGVGYYAPLTQWSHGSYPDADNAAQDDVDVLSDRLGARVDEASDLPAAAAPLPLAEALIGSDDDVDAYTLGSCQAGSVVDVGPAPLAPNLDIRAVLRDSLGQEVEVSQPPSGVGDGITATGVGGLLTVPTTGDGYVLTVEGVGEGDWDAGGYDDYGSLGAYTVSAPGCSVPTDGVPTAPLEPSAGDATVDSLTLSWTEPAAAGSSPVTGYLVSRSGSSQSWLLPPTARSHTFTGLASGTSYGLSVRAVNGVGAGPAVTVTESTLGLPAAAPSAPRNLTGTHDAASETISLWWAEPASPGTAPISGYVIWFDGARIGNLPADQLSVSLGNLSGVREGIHVVEVAAVSAAGVSPRASVEVMVDHPDTAPAPPTQVTALPGDSSATVSWLPADDGGSPVTSWTITTMPGGDTTVVADGEALTSTVTGLANGTRYRFVVAATNSVGTSEASARSEPVVPSGSPLRMKAPAVEVAGSTAVVTWRAAKANGAPIRRYKVDVSKGRDKTVSAGTRRTVLKRLERGRYTVRIKARNANGWGPYSAKVRFRVR